MPTGLSRVVGSGNGYRNYQLFTVSGTFTVPAGVFRLKLGAQGGGSSGRTSPGGSASFASGAAGGDAGSYVAAEFDVRPNDVITYFIGTGGVAPAGSPNNFGAGGNTYAKIGEKMLLVAFGGAGVATNQNAPAAAAVTPQELVLGGFGGLAGSSGSNGNVGGIPRLTSLTGVDAFIGAFDSTSPTQRVLMQAGNSQPVSSSFGLTQSSGGSGSGSQSGGGGGASSFFGRGGNGGNAGSSGQNAPSDSYGAGGGGGGGSTINNFNLGGNGTVGCLQIWY